MMARYASRLGAMFAACTLLAACAVAPPRPAPEPATVRARPEPPPTKVAPLAHTISPAEPWASLVASFVLHDCNDSPLVQAKLAMFTRSPAHFERALQRALPLMMYVQEQLQASGIPGEFAMLPMLESSYNVGEPSIRGDPAGMWQLMPATARRHGIVIRGDYDGRLDPVASTHVAIYMLSAFSERFGDWRLVDMAYNAGPHAVSRAIARHPELGASPIPTIPLSATTRKHLAKLMALSCILRQPGRFQVQLPRPSPADRLAAVQVPSGLRLRDAARMANLSEEDLRALNPGYLGARIPAHSPGRLLMPTTAADALAAALETRTPGAVADAAAPRHAASAVTAPAGQARTTRHRVRKGESLWSIAQHYDVSVGDLKSWNDLDDDDIRPGQELRVGG